MVYGIEIFNAVSSTIENKMTNGEDTTLLSAVWDAEYLYFRHFTDVYYFILHATIMKGFDNLDEFISTANLS